MARLEDLAQQAGEIKPEEGKTYKRQLQDATGIYDGRADRPSSYTEPEILRAVALYRLYGSYAEVSRETGVPSPTIHRWVNNSTSVAAKIGNFDSKLEETYKLLIDNCVLLMTEAQQQIHKRLPDASAAQAATIFGILSDKVRYMAEGKREQTSTSLHFNLAGLSPDAQRDLLDRALHRQEQRDEERAAIDAEFTEIRREPESDSDSDIDM